MVGKRAQLTCRHHRTPLSVWLAARPTSRPHLVCLLTASHRLSITHRGVAETTAACLGPIGRMGDAPKVTTIGVLISTAFEPSPHVLTSRPHLVCLLSGRREGREGREGGREGKGGGRREGRKGGEKWCLCTADALLRRLLVQNPPNFRLRRWTREREESLLVYSGAQRRCMH